MTSTPRLSELLRTIARHASTDGDALAVADETRSATYRQLVAETDTRTARLVDAGVESGDRVAVVAENSADYLISVLAIWAADAVPVTIYPSTAQADLRTTLVDADPIFVYADQQTEELVRAAVGDLLPVVRIDHVDATIVRGTGSTPTPAELRDALALICYSSGTTARPKAIMLSAEAILNTARTFGETWRLSPEDVTLVCLPVAWLFGLTTSSITTLASGGAVVTVRRAKPELIAEAISRHRVTFLPAVTTVLTKLALHLDDADADVDLSSLRLIVSGGEPRNEASFAKILARVGVPVHDNYCASEMQPLVTYDPFVDPHPRQGAAGKLVARSELKILDAAGVPVTGDEAGEGFSRGPGLMLGYWNDAEATAEAITADGWYRTKDLLRVDGDGYVHVVGRTSDMIIRGGSNVSPGEVEQLLRTHPTVADVAVVGIPDPVYGEEVVAVIQVRDGSPFDVDELRQFAKAGLSGFKVPTRVLRVEQLPHNATGKVNRRTVKQNIEQEGLV